MSDAGTVTETWADLAIGIRAQLLSPGVVTAAAPRRFAEVEFDEAYGAADETVLDFRVRFIHGLTTADRVSYSGNAYKITGLTEIGRRRGLEIRCRLVA